MREAAGKPGQGTLSLSAASEGNLIVIEISDDGKGIDVDAVRARAIDRGLIHPEKILPELDAVNFIFERGFSTAEKVTNVSGRRVGLDVVKRQLVKLGGTVSLLSARGAGSTFTVRLPLTLAVVQGLLTQVGTETYALPVATVLESLRIPAQEVRVLEGFEVFHLRAQVVPLLRLGCIFRIPRSAPTRARTFTS